MGVVHQPDFTQSFDPAWKIVLLSEIDIRFPIHLHLDAVFQNGFCIVALGHFGRIQKFAYMPLFIPCNIPNDLPGI